jgi:fatty aldehyde-generating acyl-ACP reductase
MSNSKFAFLVHSRNTEDIFRKYPFLKFFPYSLVNWVLKYWPPIIVSKITGLKSIHGNDLVGYIIGIPMTARQMMEDRAQALNQIKKASKLAEKMGVGIIGFGALTSSFSKGGLDIVNEVENLGITTGRAYTTKTVSDYAKKCIEEFGYDKETVIVAIVGAGGSVGSSCAKILAEYGVKNFLFIDLEKRGQHLKEQVTHMHGKHEDLNIEISHLISEIKAADIVLTATNAPEVLVKSEDVAPGTIIINDAQPSDVSPDIIKNRDDVLVIEGGIINTPGIKCNFNFGLASREDTFCCLGEVLILAYNEHFKHFALGELDLGLINEIEDMSKGLHFKLAKYQNDYGFISDLQIENLKTKVREKVLQ